MNWKEKMSKIESHLGHHEKRDWESAIEIVEMKFI